MEEILASINRIISEDQGSASVASETPERVLELTEAIDEDGSVRHLAPRPPATGAAPPKISEGAGSVENKSEPPGSASGRSAEAAPAARAAGEPQMAAAGLVSPASAGAAAAAFAGLASLARERRREGEVPLGGVERTLEEIVREGLRPLLQAWLDQHLPGLVERLVREEIARVVRDAGLR